jgi:2-oxoisovalerate dehydrogenase E1 component
MKAWQEHDAIERYATALQNEGLIGGSDFNDMQEEVKALITRVLSAAADTGNAPLVEPPSMIGGLMFNNQSMDFEALPAADLDLSSCSRLRQNSKKARFGCDEDGKVLSPMRAITLRDALFESVLHHMLRDESLIAYGEECREWGGAFGVYRGLSDIFPNHRLFNSPISEATIVSSAVGYAMEGGRALVELMYADFIGRAGDEIFNQMSKWQAMSGARLQLPVVLRCSVGSKYGAQHSQDWSSLVAHIPGLKVVYPTTPYDAKGLLATALSSNDPVVFFESQRLYDATEQHHRDCVPVEYYQLPFGQPDIKRSGDAVTLLTIGPCLYPALEAAGVLAEQYNLQAEVIDARTLVPFDYDAVVKSVEKTGRIMIISEACERGSFACTLAANIARYAFSSLKAAPQVLGAPNWIVPGAEMESSYFPQSSDILALVAHAFYPEAGIVVQSKREFDTQSLSPLGI